MFEVLSKPLGEITSEDIQSLIEGEVPEDERIEFKRGLPAADGKTVEGKCIPWMTPKGHIGESAKKKVLKEVVAFANTYGGVLFIGIDESEEKPSVATKISPVPRCEDLAERLKQVFRDCVEPKLIRLDIVGIPTKGKSGVVVIRVGKSRLAPHRITKTLVCPIRRADRSEGMTMYEIQDMTLNVSRGPERLEKRLSDRSERFKKEFDRLDTPQSAYGIRLTAAPVVDEVVIDEIFRPDTTLLVEGLEMPKTKVLGEKSDLAPPPNFPAWAFGPLLRSARAETIEAQDDLTDQYLPPLWFNYSELHSDGLLELGFLSVTDEENDRIYSFYPDFLMVMFANLAVWADRIRQKARAPSVEYALEVETCNLGNAGFVRTSNRVLPDRSRKLHNTIFPRYPLDVSNLDVLNGVAKLLTVLHRDLWHSFRWHHQKVDFEIKTES